MKKEMKAHINKLAYIWMCACIQDFSNFVWLLYICIVLQQLFLLNKKFLWRVINARVTENIAGIMKIICAVITKRNIDTNKQRTEAHFSTQIYQMITFS